LDLSELNEQLNKEYDDNEQKLQRELLRIQTISEAIDGGFKINKNDSNFSILYISEKLAGMLGYTVEEFLMVSDSYWRTMVDMDDVRKDSKTAIEDLENGRIYTLNYKMRCKDGGWKNVQDRGRLIRTEGQEDEVWSIIIDRDEVIKTEKALEIAKSANNSKTTFLNNMSHDIRTPMNAILGFAQLMENKINNPDVIKDYVSKIKNSSEYLLSIINNVLDMARIESGKIELDECVMCIKTANVNIMDVFESEINRKKLDFTCSINVEHKYVFGDQQRVAQILINLISNAIKYTPENGKIHVDISEYPCDKDGYAIYETTVSDTGIGMSKEFQNIIFDSFSRERTTTESKVIGSGLGMSIVKRLVDLMGGTIEIQSELGNGSTFKIRLCHKLAEQFDEVLSDDITASTEEINFSGKRVLLTEDNDINAEIAITVLENIGFSVERAADGVECIDMINNAAADYYDLILMDIQMPVLNGYATSDKIRKINDSKKSAIPIIAMTANAFEEDKKAALESGMNGYVSKPFNIPDLIKVISDIFKKQENSI